MKDVYKVCGDMNYIYLQTKNKEEITIEVKTMSKKDFDQITDRRLMGTDLNALIHEVQSHLNRFITEDEGLTEFKYKIVRIND